MLTRTGAEWAFLSKVLVGDGCWEWQRSIDSHGYGQFGARRAHRYSYTYFVGPIPDGLELDHLCRNPRCVRPDHLEPVTHAENSRRRPYYYRQSQRRQAAMPVLYIRVAEELHAQLEDIARQYDRSLTAIVTHGLETYLAEHFDWQPARPLSLP